MHFTGFDTPEQWSALACNTPIHKCNFCYWGSAHAKHPQPVPLPIRLHGNSWPPCVRIAPSVFSLFQDCEKGLPHHSRGQSQRQKSRLVADTSKTRKREDGGTMITKHQERDHWTIKRGAREISVSQCLKQTQLWATSNFKNNFRYSKPMSSSSSLTYSANRLYEIHCFD